MSALLVLIPFFFLFTVLIGPLKFLPIVLTDVRQLQPILLITYLGLIVIIPRTRKIFVKLFNTWQGLFFCLLYFVIGLSSLMAPSSEPKSLLVMLVAPGGFLMGYFLYRSFPNKNHLTRYLLIFISAIGIILSIYSLLIFVLGQSFVQGSRIFVLDKIVEYQLYDMARGRIYPITPLEFFVAPILFLVLFSKKFTMKIKLFVSSFPLLALLVSNYRLKTTWGILVALIIWKKSKQKMIYLVLLILGTLAVSAFFLSTNYFIRISLARAEDINSISKRVISIEKNLRLMGEQPLWGIGIGNYVKYADWKWIDSTSDMVVSFENPHNFYLTLATEGGILSIGVYVLLLFLLMRSDLQRVNLKENYLLLPLYLSSWIFVLNSAFDWYPANLLTYFFFLRGIIYAASAPLVVDKNSKGFI